MSDTKKLLIRFDITDHAKAEQLASSLKDELVRACKNNIQIEPHRDDPHSLNFGGELILQPFEISEVAPITDVLITFFKKQGACVTLVLEDSLKTITSPFSINKAQVEDELKQFLKLWFTKPPGQPNPQPPDNEQNKSIKRSGLS